MWWRVPPPLSSYIGVQRWLWILGRKCEAVIKCDESLPAKVGRQRRQPGVGRPRGLVDLALAPLGLGFGQWLSTVRSCSLFYVFSLFTPPIN